MRKTTVNVHMSEEQLADLEFLIEREAAVCSYPKPNRGTVIRRLIADEAATERKRAERAKRTEAA